MIGHDFHRRDFWFDDICKTAERAEEELRGVDGFRTLGVGVEELDADGEGGDGVGEEEETPDEGVREVAVGVESCGGEVWGKWVGGVYLVGRGEDEGNIKVMD